ncbi:retrovirus-related pol polyprotein from transposon TNT 1-94 [Tanacetum coccineum]
MLTVDAQAHDRKHVLYSQLQRIDGDMLPGEGAKEEELLEKELLKLNPQQNSVAKRRNRTLIKADRTMLADSKLPTTFWAEAVNTTCYVKNRVLVVKPHNKTPYELFRGKFDGKSDEGFFIGYSLNSKAFRVYNIRTRKVEENLHIRVQTLKNFEGTKESGLYQNASNDEPQPSSDAGKKDDEGISKENGADNQEKPEDSHKFPSTPNTRIHKEHSLDHVIGDMQSGVQTRRMIKTTNEQGFIRNPKEGNSTLTDPSWIESMQDELLQFKLQQVWTLVDLPYGKRAIGTKWIYRNKKDERGIVIRIKARLVAQGYTQEEGIDYDEVFALKSAFMYGKIEEEVYVYQPLGFEDPEFPDKVYKVASDDLRDALSAIFGLSELKIATVRTVDNGEQEITATVDGKEFTITEASVRRHLQLADVDGISVLPTTKIFAQLSLMGYVSTDDKLTFQKEKFSP